MNCLRFGWLVLFDLVDWLNGFALLVCLCAFLMALFCHLDTAKRNAAEEVFEIGGALLVEAI